MRLTYDTGQQAAKVSRANAGQSKTDGGKTRPSIPVAQPRQEAPSTGVIQRLTKTGYASFDSWQNWNGSYKPGAEEKWEHLRMLYDNAEQIINKSANYPKEIIETLVKINGKTIGLSEYEAVLEELNGVHRAIDKTKLEESRTYRSDFLKELLEFNGKTCRFSESAEINYQGNAKFINFTKALLCKIETSGFGKEICETILQIIEDPLTKHPITFKPGAECLAHPGKDSSVVELLPQLNDYASGIHGQIIPSTIEIALVHELGHLWQHIKGKRGRPKTEYSSLHDEEKGKWSNEEEYVNINQVENKFRKSIKVEQRKYHSGDPLIHSATLDLSFLFKNAEEVNLSILKEADDGDLTLLLSADEIIDFEEMKGLMKRDDLDDTEILDLRYLVRKHDVKISRLKDVKRPIGSKYKEYEQKAKVILNNHKDWTDKQIPDTGW